ncbi:MAG: TIGR03067 domain-containing protein [Pirellulales bacterium]|nr:TIGR03067 domain-containing protein [Pirellulales bacterium]
MSTLNPVNSHMPPFVRIGAVVITVGLFGWETAARADLGLNDFRQMQGAWTLMYSEQNGAQLLYDVSGLGKLLVSGDRYLLSPQCPGAASGRFALNASRQPRQIDFVPLVGSNAGQLFQGIYELNGDTQRVCFAPPGQPRPISFFTMPGTGQISYVWLRIPNTAPAANRFRSSAPAFPIETR